MAEDSRSEPEIVELGPETELVDFQAKDRSFTSSEIAKCNPGLLQEYTEQNGAVAKPTQNQLQTQESIGNVGVTGGDFRGSSLGPQDKHEEFHVTNNEGVSGSNFSGANFGKIFEYHFHAPAALPATRPKNSRDSLDQDEGALHLGCNIWMFHEKKICDHPSIYYGEQRSGVTPPRPLAIKLLPNNEKNATEAKNLVKLDSHSNVVHIIHSDAYKAVPIPYIYIAMELCDEKTLGDYINNVKSNKIHFEFTKMVNFSKQLVEGIAFIHTRDVIHRDLKPDNVLFSKDKTILKIADFGLSKTLKHGKSVTKQSVLRPGTDGYRAPETYKCDLISKQTDIFSLGLVIYTLLSGGHHPFGDEEDLWNYNIKTNIGRSFDHLPEEADGVRNLLQQMLHPDPKKRPTAVEILRHPFFANQTFTAVEQATGEVESAAQFDNSKVAPSPSLLFENPHHSKAEAGDVSKLSSSSTLPEHDQQHQGHEESKANFIVMLDRITNSFFYVNPEANQWQQMQSPEIGEKKSKSCFSALLLAEHIYILMETREVHRLSCSDSNSEWTKLPNMQKNHGQWPPGIVFQGAIYVIGGSFSRDEEDFFYDGSRTAERFNPVTSRWRLIESLSEKKNIPAIAATKDHIYCIGGRSSENKDLTSVERFDPQTEHWGRVSDLKIARSFPLAVAWNEQIYVIDPIKHLFIECYNPLDNVWTMLQVLLFPFSDGWYIRPVVVDGKIYGVQRNDNKCLIARLDLDAKRWIVRASLKEIDVDVHATFAAHLSDNK